MKLKDLKDFFQNEINGRYSLFAVYLFGSQKKKKELTADRDIDIAIFFNDNSFPGQSRRQAIRTLLNSRFGNEYKFDLLLYPKSEHENDEAFTFVDFRAQVRLTFRELKKCTVIVKR